MGSKKINILPTNSMLGPISSYPKALMDKSGLLYISSSKSFAFYLLASLFSKIFHKPLLVCSFSCIHL